MRVDVTTPSIAAMSYSKGRFTLDEIEFIQAATVKVLVAVGKGELDLNLIAREELAQRGLDQNGLWIGFERARRQQADSSQVDPL
ncbi:MAG: hypothetical protein ACK443_06605 [Methylococcaceae bacterium]|jgi:hypothetical protein